MKPQAPSSDIMPGSVVIDQPGPYYPDAVLTITVTYDQEARKGNRTPQYPYHPQFQAMYGQAGKGQIFMWIGDPDSAASIKNNHDGTFTAHGIPLLTNVTEHPGWDPTQPGTLDFGVYNIKEVNGQMIWTCYAWGEFVIEPVPA